MSYPIDAISSQIQEINFQGNVIPSSWKDFIRHNDRPDLNSMYLLSEIIYWYRPICTRDEDGNEQYFKKYKADLLQKGYRQFEKSTGLSEKQIRASLERLEDLGLVKRHLRTIESQIRDSDETRKVPNILFIEIFPEKIKEITIARLKKELRSLPRGNHPLPRREPPLSPEGTTYTETTSKTTSEIKGIDLVNEETLPFESEKKALKSSNTKFSKPSKLHEPYYNKMMSMDLKSDSETILIVIREAFKQGKEEQLKKAISHVEAEFLKGTKFKASPIAMLRSVLNGKISPISKNAKKNKETVEFFKEKSAWETLKITDKYIYCEKCPAHEVILDQTQEQFSKNFESLFNLSKRY